MVTIILGVFLNIVQDYGEKYIYLLIIGYVIMGNIKLE